MKALQAVVFSFLIFSGLLARAEFRVPRLTGPVVDQARMLSGHDERLLEDLIRQFQRSGKAQIQVLTVPTLDGLTIEQASLQVVDQWKLGGAKTDNGLLLMVSEQDRKIRFEVGQGLEGVIPDVVAKRIIEDVMIPLFRQGSPSQGIVIGVYQSMKRIDETFSAESNMEQATVHRERSSAWKGLLIFVAILFILLFGGGGRGRRRGLGWGAGAGAFGGFGGGGFGGGGGGGWSGGGGGFSGGGASGGW